MPKLPKKNIFQIILTSNGKQIKTLYSCASEKKVNEKFKELSEKNKSVKFPVRFINIGKLINAHYEIFIIKKNENEPKITKLKDENGKIKNFETNNENWIIYDRNDFEREETFWVYGFHPVFQRKDFKWIFDNLLNNNNSKNNIKQVIVYQNKLLISTTFKLDMVLCKNESDCIRLYNDLEKEISDKKVKYVFFGGDAYHSFLKNKWMEKMKKLTGWKHHKLARNSLRP